MIDVEVTEDGEEWNRYVERADGATVFHRDEFIERAADHSSTTLYRLVGRKGSHPVGIFPVFEGRAGPFTLAFSPPPGAGIPYLGPARLLDPNVKFRSATKTTHAFLEASLAWIDESIAPRYTRLLTTPWFEDVRPLVWSDFDVSPAFTHHLALEPDEETLLDRFSRDARRSITDDYDVEYTIEADADEGIDFLVDRLQDRYESQGLHYRLTRSYVEALASELPPETLEVALVRVDGRPVTGRLSLFHDGTVSFWQGVPKPADDIDLPTNDLLNWHVLTRAKSRGCTLADLSGGNTERLWSYKAKFNPTLSTYHEAVRAGPVTGLAASVAASFASNRGGRPW